jgi:hypothetical protein
MYLFADSYWVSIHYIIHLYIYVYLSCEMLDFINSHGLSIAPLNQAGGLWK